MQQQQKSNSLLWAFLLIIVALGAILVFLAQAHPGGSGSGNAFNAQQEAFQLAQDTQAYRQQLQPPQKSNFGLASIILFFNDGSEQRFVPVDRAGKIKPFPGYDPSTSHSEFLAHGWVLYTLRSLKKSGLINANTTSVYVVIFSQVRVCDECKNAMKGWRSEFRQEAGTKQLLLSVWQLTRGYDPAEFPGGKPVTGVSDVREVRIAFTFTSFPSHTPARRSKIAPTYA